MASVGDETCRICRSEGTPEEPLYHPCKCSGSIKYVHQDCLMEWLQHSQKKHCELCKTSFRFTKVYDPHMPKTLPFFVFLKLAFNHLIRLVIQILRLSSVLFVWLFWLPWTVRTVWRFYFYVADGGLIEHGIDTAAPLSNHTYNISISLAPGLTGLIGPDVISTLEVRDTSAINETQQERLTDYLLQSGTFRLGAGLTNLTSSKQFNQVMVDTFEGQVITILVVLAFILIFLIREWVVQQQPPPALDGNGQPVQQQDPRVEELLAEIERHRQRREANQQAGAEHMPAPPPQPMFGGGGGGDDEADGEDNSSEESVFGGNNSELSFRAGRTEESDGEMPFHFEEPAPVDVGELSFSTTRPSFLPEDDDDDENESEQTPIVPTENFLDEHTFPDASNSENEASSSQHPRPEFRPILPIRKRKAFQPDNAPTTPSSEGSSFAFQPISSASPFQFGSTPQTPLAEPSIAGEGVGRPNISRELSGRAAELRRAIEEQRSKDVTHNNPWDGQFLADVTEELDTEEAQNVAEPAKNPEPTADEASLIDFSEPSQDIPESSTGAAPNPYSFDLSSSGSDFNWNRYTEYTHQSDQTTSRKGKAPVVSTRESSSGSDVSRKRASDMSWEELVEMKEDALHEVSSDDVPQITAFDDASSDDDVDFHEEVQREILARAAERFGDNDGRIADRIRNTRPITVQEIAELVRNSQVPSAPAPTPTRRVDEVQQPEIRIADAGNDNEEAGPAPPPIAPIVANPPAPAPPIAPPVIANAAAANGAPNEDVEVDVDDFDGVMELIGMRGPLLALAQNGIFSAVLISATIGIGVWIPYIWGRIVLLILSNPLIFFITLPYKAVIFTSELFIDLAIMFGSFVVHFSDRSGRFILIPASWVLPNIKRVVNSQATADMTYKLASEAHSRISKSVATIFTYRASMRQFQSQHILGPPYKWPANQQSWDMIYQGISKAANVVGLNGTDITIRLNQLIESQKKMVSNITEILGNNSTTSVFNATTINSTESGNSTFIQDVTIDPDAFAWTPFDRVVTVIAGYVFISIVGAFYLQHKKNLAKKGIHPRGLDRKAVEVLGQAGSVMKVVLIIGIEMFVFPLYCGFLLDLALLPLFEHATVWNRWLFLKEYMFTSLFVHWFIGTCYMFHFALFVSMCRNIMRDGVLYFIRDPDDPTFHPVKEVLERPVTTQLKKIGFSAIIYGVLVIMFLGGVVWALHYSFSGLLPVHWSSNEPVLEFPVDLLFYNIFMPLAIKYFRPANIVEKIYGWWFRQCAKVLRLSSFMFGERRPEEEGIHIRKTWTAWLLRKQWSPPTEPAEGEEKVETEQETNPNPDVDFERNGRFVRAPAKDSVRPTRENLFIPVNDKNERIDGRDDPSDGDFGPSSENVTMVYLPPNFKTRIGFVIGLIWFFAAFTGVALTVGPLVFGRFILGMMLPGSLRMNDLYAFSLGLYALGAVVLAVSSFNAAKEAAKKMKSTLANLRAFREAAWICTVRALKIAYVLTAFVVVLPTLFAFVMEAYIILPLHTYFSTGDSHVVHFIQDWTLGVLYVKMLGRMILLDRESAWSRSLRAIVAQGYLNPDVGIATKKFVLPAGGAMLAALFVPLAIGYGINNFIVRGATPELTHQIYRYSYPAVFLLSVASVGLYFLYKLFDVWKQSLRDEIYLVGEQLHNHGERRPPQAAAEVTSTTLPAPAEELELLLNDQGEPNVPEEAAAQQEEPQQQQDPQQQEQDDAERDAPVHELQRMDSSVQATMV